ncbi:MAG: hypothetical protein ACRDMI_06245 [Streptosporangiaceae bacterium]
MEPAGDVPMAGHVVIDADDHEAEIALLTESTTPKLALGDSLACPARVSGDSCLFWAS